MLEINKAINDLIKNALIGTSFSPEILVAEDVSEPIVRPSLKTSIETTVTSGLNSASREKTITCRIYFFASDRYKYKIENAKMQEILEAALLSGIFIDNNYIPIEEVTSETTDTVLICSFDLYIIESLPEPTVNGIGETLEDMDTLSLNLVKE